MKAIRLNGDIDENHRLHAEVPDEFPAGPVRLIVLVPEEDDAGLAWMRSVSQEWDAEVSDPMEDVYTLADGQPVNESR